MSLLQLPPELLIHVLNYVGSAYFQEDLARLPICKQWFRCAHDTWLQSLQLSQKTLRQLLSLSDAEIHLTRIRSETESLSLKLEGFQDWSSLPGAPEPEDEHVIWQPILDSWTTAVNTDIAQLALTVVQQSRKVRVLHIRAWSERDHLNVNRPYGDYLKSLTIQALLSARHLTVLDLDLCGTLPIPRWPDQHDDIHICKIIAGLLTTLQRLRLRMRKICPAVLCPPPSDTKLPLRSVHLKLSIDGVKPRLRSYRSPSWCIPFRIGFEIMEHKFNAQARALAARMEAPEAVRVLIRTVWYKGMFSFDALTHEERRVKKRDAWEDEGETMSEWPTESEESDVG